MKIPVSLHIIRRPIIPEITLILSIQRMTKEIPYERYLMTEAIKLIEIAEQKEYRGKLIAIDASEVIQGIGFNGNVVRCHFTLFFNNDYNLNNFLSRLNSE